MGNIVLESLETAKHLIENSTNECWVAKFDNVIVPGVNQMGFAKEGNAKRSFAQQMRRYGISPTPREEMEKSGRLKFVNLNKNYGYSRE